MLVLGLQGSPRRKGNSDFLLSTFLEHARQMGAQTETIDTERRHITPCKEYVVCEKKGYCPIRDDMDAEIYGLLRTADVIVAATPVFFYSMTAQLKALVDRCQTLWARKYRFKLTDPGSKQRLGWLLSVGATRGKHLFEGIELSIRYFFDAVDAHYAGNLMYRGIEHRNDLARRPGIEAEIRQTVETLLAPLTDRRRILFVGRRGSRRSQIAAAFARLHGGAHLDVLSAGTDPADRVDPAVVRLMAKRGIDLAFGKTLELQAAIDHFHPQMLVRLGSDVGLPDTDEIAQRNWSIADPSDETDAVLEEVYEQVEHQIQALILDLNKTKEE